MKKFVLIMLSVAIVGMLAGLGVWHYICADETGLTDAGVVKDDNTVRAPKDSAPVQACPSGTVACTASPVVARVNQVTPVVSTNRVAPVVVAANHSTNDVTLKAKDSPANGMAAMMKSPAMKEMLKAERRVKLDSDYAPLFKYLNLSYEDATTFKNLLVEREMATTLDMDFDQSESEAEENKAKLLSLVQTGDALVKTIDEKIKAVLGDEKFAVYNEYEATQPERKQIDQFKNALSSADQMTNEQENDVIRAMYEERMKIPFAPEIVTSSEGINNYLQNFAQLQSSCLAKVSSILSPSQLAQFKQSQEQQRVMKEMGMKVVAAQLFGGTKASDNGSAN